MENNSSYKETFFIVPRYILELPGITFAYIKVYETIFQFWNKGCDCYLGESSLCERTGLKRAIVYRALDFFESKNELMRQNINGRRYIIKPQSKIETSIPTSTPVDPNVHSRRPSTSTGADHNIKKVNKENNKKEKIYKKEKSGNDSVSSCTNESRSEMIESSPPIPTETKEVAKYQETLFPMPAKTEPTGKRELAIHDLTDTNPHKIPAAMISDWLAVRKSAKKPVTSTAWRRLNNQLDLCKDPKEAFEIMVAHGWNSLHHTWIEKITNQEKKNGHFDYDDTTWAGPEFRSITEC